MTRQVFTGAAIFDGTSLHDGMTLVVAGGIVTALVPDTQAPEGPRVALAGGVLAPGMIDLQVNGGAGVMIGAGTTVETIRAVCAAHARLGATGILPTLITDTPAVTAQVVAAAIGAARTGVPGFIGLHLEGPHLDPRRKGAHDPALIRPMTDDDLGFLCRAAADLPVLLVTLAPAAATPAQVTTLTRAGVRVSLGHADCTYDQAMRAIDAGACMATHLFNAMSQIAPRDPGLVGAVLSSGLPAGLIADGIHVHPANLRIALAAGGPGLFLVSDAMAVAGSDRTEFHLGGRRIIRQDGRLTLEDGTLAGADLSLPQAVSTLAHLTGIPLPRALAMSGRIPAGIIGIDKGKIAPGLSADFVHLDGAGTLAAVWTGGNRIV